MFFFSLRDFSLRLGSSSDFHDILFIFLLMIFLKWAALSRSCVCSDKLSVDFPRLPFPHWHLFFFFFLPEITWDFIEYSIPFHWVGCVSCLCGSIPWHLGLPLCFSMALWEIGFPRFPLSSVTLVMILGASMLEDFTLTMIFNNTQNILWYSKIYANFFSLFLPRSLYHLILILKGNNNPMNHIYQTSLKMASDSSRKSISFRDTLLPLKI